MAVKRDAQKAVALTFTLDVTNDHATTSTEENPQGCY